MRLFTSIDFPDDILEEVRSWIPDIKGWRKLPLAQLHLTLVFLGECSEKEKKEIHLKLSEIDFSAFTITISGIGAFPNESVPRIMWAEIQQHDELMNLQQKISDQLQDYIKSNDAHPFVPHITLARKKSGKRMNQDVKQNLQNETKDLNVYIDSYHLKKSILKSAGSEHHILHQYGAVSDQ